MMEIKQMKRGDYMLHKGEPHRIKNIGIVVTGTHSHTKAKIDIQGLFSGKNETFTLPPHERVEEVDVTRKAASCIAKDKSNLQIMDSHSFETFDAEVLNDELKTNIQEGDEVTYVMFNGRIVVLEKRG